MDSLGGILIGTQLVFTVIAGLYFYTHLKSQHSNKSSISADSREELEKLKKLQSIHLTKPLSEKTRPDTFSEIVGQEQGLKALRASICGPNPQHVLIYGPPGVGKTAAARVVLKEAIKSEMSPFNQSAPFIEMDATILQFDERSIADPLIGSVHDPIYQGAGAYGQAGIPQPKQGAATKAHGGILFLDEIGELHHLQMNKLLKVLEDRKVYFTSSYYSKHDANIPKHIHEIFEHGLPADFRLVGATTRRPEEIPPALRSRCAEVFFNPLKAPEVKQIAQNACLKAGFAMEKEVDELIARYSRNGRDTVNIVQMAASLSTLDGRQMILVKDVEEVLEYGRHTPCGNKKVVDGARIGIVNGLAVYGSQQGAVMEIEVSASKKTVDSSTGNVLITGIVEEEEINNYSGKMRRKSTAKGSVENVVTLLNKLSDNYADGFDIHINFPGGMPVDGPSAGTAIFIGVYSALYNLPVSAKVAFTGEISIKGKVCPVGGVRQKIEAAVESGIEKVYIPNENWQSNFKELPIEIVKVQSAEQLIQDIFDMEIHKNQETSYDNNLKKQNLLTAKSIES